MVPRERSLFHWGETLIKCFGKKDARIEFRRGKRGGSKPQKGMRRKEKILWPREGEEM